MSLLSAFECLEAAIKRIVKGPLSKDAVEHALSAAAARATEHLEPNTSVVDLMKVLGLDSSIEGRQDMADSVGCDGPDIGTAEGNTALHAKIMRRLEERYIALPGS